MDAFSCFSYAISGYADINKLTPTGAGSMTAKDEGLSIVGVQASNEIAEKDWPAVQNYLPCFNRVGNKHNVPPCVIAGMASRESHVGKDLNSTNGWSANNQSYGILQCDIQTSGLGRQGCTQSGWDTCDLVETVIEKVFLPKLQDVANQIPSKKWAPERQLQAAVAAYNLDIKKVQEWDRLDDGSTGNDYSNDVIARAQYFCAKIAALG